MPNTNEAQKRLDGEDKLLTNHLLLQLRYWILCLEHVEVIQ